jgi:hypothetical protein
MQKRPATTIIQKSGKKNKKNITSKKKDKKRK